MRPKIFIAIFMISFAFHITGLVMGLWLYLQWPFPPMIAALTERAIPIERMPPQELKNIKFPGIQNGQDSRTLPVPYVLEDKEKTFGQNPEGEEQDSAKFKSPREESLTIRPEGLTAVYRGSKENYQWQNTLFQDLLKDKTNTDVREYLKGANLRTIFIPPRGVDPDQLNSADKKFFSFSRRLSETYQRTMIRSARENILRHPSTMNSLENATPHVLSGRVIYDRDGNIVSVKIIRWSHDDNLENVFEDGLKGLPPLPNFPQEWPTEDDQYVVYYELTFL
jgi:hypothetical protein